MGKRLKKIGIIIISILVLSGCGKSKTQAWVENTEALQAWYEVVTDDTAEVKSHQEYVEQFLTSHKEEPDYGLAYGMTAVLCEELEVCELSADCTDEELAVYLSNTEQMYLLDFTLPMFETYFFDEKTVEYVQAAAVSFAEYVNEQEKLDELYQICLSDSEEDATRLVELKNEWLANLGVENVYEPFAVLPFEYNERRELKEYPYVMSDTEANWYFHPDDVKEYGYKAFVEEYLITEELMELDFPEVRELFENYLPEEVPEVDICTMLYEEDVDEGARYNKTENRIQLFHNWNQIKHALVHEYVHYLTTRVVPLSLTGSPVAEGIAEEAATWGCKNRLRTLANNQLYGEDEIRASIFWDEERGGLNDGVFTNWFAYNYYAGAFSGETYFAIAGYSKERPEKIQFFGELSYDEMASITHYLVESYGRETVYANFYDYDSFMAFVGGDFGVFYDDWGAWCKEQCDEVLKM